MKSERYVRSSSNRLFGLILMAIVVLSTNVIKSVYAQEITIKTISAGYYHSGFVTQDGWLWITGNNQMGQLGNGSLETKTEFIKVMSSVKIVSAGAYHTAILKTDNTLWMCGQNTDGRLGNGGSSNVKNPVKIMDNVQDVSAGGYHTVILKKDGTLWTCGNNYYGQLGNNSKTDQHVPIKIMDDVKAISAGGRHTAAIKKDGTLWVWGQNYNGEVGNGTCVDQLVPRYITSSVKSVSCGSDHTAIIKTDGSLWTFGRNACGQLGNGKWTDCSTPQKIMDGVKAVGSGGFTTVILKNDGSIWSCGNYSHHALGYKADSSSPIFKKIMDNVKLFDVGEISTLVLKKDGSLFSFGTNDHGQLGLGDVLYSDTPAQVSNEKVISTRISMDIYEKTMLKGDKYSIQITIEGDTGKVKWSSSDNAVAKVSKKGVVTAKKKGTATITAEVNGSKASCVIHVINNKTIILGKKTITMNAGDSEILTAEAVGVSGIKWKSSNKKVATVSKKGIIKAKKKGTTTITAYSGSVKATCKVTVKEGLDISKYIGKSIDVAVNKFPEGVWFNYKNSTSWETDHLQKVRFHSGYRDGGMVAFSGNTTDRVIYLVEINSGASSKYSIMGFKPGMTLNEAKTKAKDNKWAIVSQLTYSIGYNVSGDSKVILHLGIENNKITYVSLSNSNYY